MKNVVIMGVLMFALCACSHYASNGDSLYLSSKNGPNLLISPPLSQANISHFYDLPAQNKSPVVSIAP